MNRRIKTRKLLALVLAVLTAISMMPGLALADVVYDEEPSAVESDVEIAAADELAEAEAEAEPAEAEEAPAEERALTLQEEEPVYVAQIGDFKYTSLAEAINSAEDGATITLLKDIENCPLIEVKKSLTLTGGETTHTIKSNASRILRIMTNNVTVNLENIAFVGSSNTERGLQVDSDKTGVELNIAKCSVSGVTHYAINFCANTKVELNVEDSVISSWGALNIYSVGFKAHVSNSKLIGTNNKEKDAWNGFGVVVIEGDTTNQTDLGASDYTIILENCEIIASQTTGNIQSAFVFNTNSKSNTMLVSGSDTKVTVPENSDIAIVNGTNNELSISGGTFSKDPSKYVAEGYKSTPTDDGYVVSAYKYELSEPTHGSASDSYTVTVDDDKEIAVSVEKDGAGASSDAEVGIDTTSVKSDSIAEIVQEAVLGNEDASSISVGLGIDIEQTSSEAGTVVYEVKPIATVKVTKGDVTTTAESIELTNDDIIGKFTITLTSPEPNKLTRIVHVSSEPDKYPEEVYFLTSDAEGKVSLEISHFSTFTLQDVSDKVAAIGGTTYDSLTAAIAAASDGDTVVLLKDAAGSFSTSKKFDIDLGGNTLTVNAAEGFKVLSDGEVNVTNGTISSEKDDIISAKGGKITLGNDLTVTCTSSALYAYEGGVITIDGASVSGNKYSAAFATGSGSAINIKSGSLSESGINVATLSIANGASALISGGTVTSDASTTVVAKGTGSLITIDGGEVSTSANFVAGYAKGDAKIVVNGGTISSNAWCALSAIKWDMAPGGHLEINGGTINKAVGAYEDTNSSLKITGGTIGAGGENWAVYISAGASGTIEGGTINGYAQVSGSGSLSVSGGSFDRAVAYKYSAEGFAPTMNESTKVYSVAPARVVSFKNGDTVLQSGKVLVGYAPEYKGETPTKEADAEYNYSFSGWTPAIANVPAGDDEIVYSAEFEKTKRVYTLSFLSDEKDIDGNDIVLGTKGYAYMAQPENYVSKASTVNKDFTFLGWRAVVNGVDGDTVYAGNAIPKVEGDATYRAVYEATDRLYTVTWKSNGSEIAKKTDYKYGDALVVPADPAGSETELAVFSFKGWSADGQNVITLPESVSANATYTALFEKTMKAQYKVKFVNYDDSELLAEASYVVGKSLTELAAAIDESKLVRPADNDYSYTFSGWVDASDNSDMPATVKKAATYKAVYAATEIGKYTVTWKNWDGSVLETDANVISGTTPYFDGEIPTRAADAQYEYSFAAWTPERVNVTADAVYTATYNSTLRKYTISFLNEDGSLMAGWDKLYSYGTKAEEISRPEAPTKAEDTSYTYSFAGWKSIADGSDIADVSGNASYKAVFTATPKQQANTGGGGGGGGGSARVNTSTGETLITIDDEAVPLADIDSLNLVDTAERFIDVPAGSWYHDAVYAVVNAGLFTGKTETTFEPSGKATREQVMTVLARLAGNENATIAEGTAWAVRNDISDGSNPKANISREQLVTMLYRMVQKNGGGFVGSWMFLLDFSDADQISSWADEAMHWAVMNGVITGYDDGTLKPKNEISRAELAAIMQRVLEKDLLNEAEAQSEEGEATSDETEATSEETEATSEEADTTSEEGETTAAE